MKAKGLLIALIISLGINLGAVGTLAYYTVRKASPRYSWKDWKKKYDETWEKVADSLQISPELTAGMRAKLKAKAEETRSINEEHKVYRDSLIELIKRPELDTARLLELLTREAEIESRVGYMMYANLHETARMLPAERQAEFVDFFSFSVRFTGKPWYIHIKSKDRSEERSSKK